MKTAREQLYEEVIVLIEKRADDGATGVMRKLMARYRVQTKPGVEIPAGTTARDALGDRLLDLWRTGAADDATRGRIGSTIDEFRMQLKQSGNGGVDKPPVVPRPPRPVVQPAPAARGAAVDPPAPRASLPSPKASSLLPAPGARTTVSASPLPPAPAASKSSRPVPPMVHLGVGEPPQRVSRGPEPVAGGPRARKKARGECPKCKSKGVVLARSYAGDEYYSCIYCGWQAYKAVDEDDPNASLAVRLLGPTAGTD
jgi:hypothetical protein